MNNFEKKCNIIKKVMEDKTVVIVDPENEYKKFAEMLGGEVVTLREKSGAFINPFNIELDKTSEVEEDTASSKAQIIKKINEISSICDTLNRSADVESILKFICFKNNIKLSRNDKEEILRHFE